MTTRINNKINESDEMDVQDRRDYIISHLKRKQRVRILLRELPINEVKAIAERINSVYEDLRQEDEKRRSIALKKRQEAERILEEMKNKNIDMELLGQILLSKSEALPPENAKFFKDGAFWSGIGRRPDPFKHLNLADLERYRILKKNK